MKKNIVYPLLGILLFIGLSAKAQFENIDLNKYKLTDYKYKTLGVNLNTANSSGFDNSNQTNNTSKANDFNLNLTGSLGYTSSSYTRKYYGVQSFGFGFSSRLQSSYSKNSFDDPFGSIYRSTWKSSNSSSNFTLSFSTTNRFYMSGDYFIGINFQTFNSPYHNYSKSETNNNSILHNRSITYNFISSSNNASFYFGKGRVENVTDAKLAIYILDDLAKQGRLSRTPSEDEVFAFADFITKTLNKRIIDDRIKRIKEFVAVDSFLVSNGLSIKTDGLYFGLINDNWNYGRLQFWSTGSLWHIGVSPTYNYQNNFSRRIDSSSISKNWNRLNQYGVSFDAGYSSSWISGLKWINGYSINASFNVFKLDSTGYFYDIYNYKSLTGNASYNISYIPSTRTTISFNAGVMFSKNFYNAKSDELLIKPLISGSCNYYFSEKLRLNVSANINYNYYKIYDYTYTQKNLDFGLNATLSYYIF